MDWLGMFVGGSELLSKQISCQDEKNLPNASVYATLLENRLIRSQNFTQFHDIDVRLDKYLLRSTVKRRKEAEIKAVFVLITDQQVEFLL